MPPIFLLVLGGCTSPAPEPIPVVADPIDEDTAVDTATVPPVDEDGDGHPEDADCDDGEPTVHPGAIEVCNGKDDDCDALTDDEDDGLDPTTAALWHPDADLDLFGAVDSSTLACVPPIGWLADGTDCDDALATVYPGATESCDTLDEDCDGQIDETCRPAPTGAHRVTEYPLRIVGEGPCFGGYLTGLGDVDADGADDLLIASLAEGGGESGAGAAWLLRGPVTAATDLSAVDPMFRGDSKHQRTGNDSIAIGDVNGDGVNDFLLGTYLTQWARLYLGPATDPTGEADAMITDAGSLYKGDRALSGLGDVDGDGFTDIVVGDHWASPDFDHYAAGAAYVYNGPLTGSLGAADADATLLGTGELQQFGFSVAGIGDVDGDGVPDLAATWKSMFGNSYSVGVYFGPFSGVRDGAADADLVIGPSEVDDTTAYRAAAWSPVLSAAAMDGDGDGRPDLLLSGEREGSGGSAFLFTSLTGASVPDDANIIITGDSGRSGAAEPTWTGDLNQDGNADLALSDVTESDRVLDGGAIYVFYGPHAPGLDLTSSADAILYGEEPGSFAGYTVAPGGELTGDAYPDLLFSAPVETLAGTADGVAWVLPGGP